MGKATLLDMATRIYMVIIRNVANIYYGLEIAISLYLKAKISCNGLLPLFFLLPLYCRNKIIIKLIWRLLDWCILSIFNV